MGGEPSMANINDLHRMANLSASGGQTGAQMSPHAYSLQAYDRSRERQPSNGERHRAVTLSSSGSLMNPDAYSSSVRLEELQECPGWEIPQPTSFPTVQPEFAHPVVVEPVHRAQPLLPADILQTGPAQMAAIHRVDFNSLR